MTTLKRSLVFLLFIGGLIGLWPLAYLGTIFLIQPIVVSVVLNLAYGIATPVVLPLFLFFIFYFCCSYFIQVMMGLLIVLLNPTEPLMLKPWFCPSFGKKTKFTL